MYNTINTSINNFSNKDLIFNYTDKKKQLLTRFNNLVSKKFNQIKKRIENVKRKRQFYNQHFNINFICSIVLFQPGFSNRTSLWQLI